MNIACVPLPLVTARFSRRPDRLTVAVISVFKSISASRKILSRLKPEMVHANTIRSGIVATLATIGSKIPVVWHVHDILPDHMLSTIIRVVARTSRRTHIVAVSHATAKAFSGTFNFQDRMRTIHNGVDLERFPLKSTGVSSFRRDLGVPPSGFLICAVGQICERKGLMELIRAFQSITRWVPEMHLAIVGNVVFEHERPYFNSLIKLAKSSLGSENIHFTGSVSIVQAVYQAADLLVLNSRQEPFGLVLVEAMSCGTPVLATRVGGIPEIVTDQVNGWLVDKDDTAALASKILALSMDRKLLEDAARKALDTTCPQLSLRRFQHGIARLYSEFDLKQGLGASVPEQLAYSLHGRT
jgi:Glycosyltransferase